MEFTQLNQKSTQKIVGTAFSIALFMMASGLFLNSAMDIKSGEPKFLSHVQMNGFTKIQVNNTILYLFLRPLPNESSSILKDVITQETGFFVENIKSFKHEGKNLKGDSISVAIADVRYNTFQLKDMAQGTGNSHVALQGNTPQATSRGLYAFFIKNFKIQSVQRITGSTSKGLQLEFGSIQTYNPQFAEGTFKISEQIQFN